MPPAHFILEAFDPESGGVKDLRVAADEIDRILRLEPRHKFFELRGDRTPTTQGSCVASVLAQPSAIFHGVREYQQGGQCYCGHPESRWLNNESEVPPPPGMLFCVYVAPPDWVYHWRWEFMDDHDENAPKDYKTRFEGRLWPTD